MDVTKVVIQFGGLELIEARDLCNSAPSMIKQCNSYQEAVDLIDKVLQYRDENKPNLIINFEIR